VTQTLRLVFDDCLSRIAVNALTTLARFSRGTVEFAHLADFTTQGRLDDDWIPEIAGKGWVLVTTDRGKQPSRGGKLPALCRKFSLTHVMLSAAMHNKNQFDKLRSLFEVWPDLVKTSEAPPGSGYSLECTAKGAAKLVHIYRPPDYQGPPVQKQLWLRG
jgi:hypothetical protein